MRIGEYERKRKYALNSKTLKSHVSMLRTFEKITGCENREPTLEDIDYFLDAFESYGLKRTSVVRYLSVVKQYLKLFNPSIVPEVDRLLEIRRPVVSQRDYRSVHLSKDDVREILRRLDEPYDLIIAIMYSFCRRLGEVLALTRSDVRRDSVTFHIFKKKNLMRVEMPMYLLPEHWQQKLFSYLEGVRGRKVFPVTARAVEYQFKRVATAIGKPDARPHDIRHARIRHALDDGVDPTIVKDTLSFHERLSTLTDIYGRIKLGHHARPPKADI